MQKARNNAKSAGKSTITRITCLNYLKLLARSALFIAALAVYLVDRNVITESIYTARFNSGTILLLVIWLVFITEMMFRLFPSKYESMGCQKQFAGNFVQNDDCLKVPGEFRKRQRKAVIIVAASWIAVVAVVGVLYFTGIIDEGLVLIISLFFAVCDIICILFYCPFQSLIMKNRCCVTCRIYNWDFLMMFAPLVFIISHYTLGLVTLAFLLFIRWEAAYDRHPEWFCEETNRALGCAACKEKLCVHKKSIRPAAREKREAGTS